MPARPADLPEYERPPLVEVVLSVQFAEFLGYRIVHAGLLWQNKFRANFPHVKENPPLNPSFEVFGPRAGPMAQLQLKQMPGPQVPRLWFSNEPQTELIQVQADRFIHNWRKVGEREQYPPYEALRERFFEELRDLDAFFRSHDLGLIEPNQCEITYVNKLHCNGRDLRVQPGVALSLFPSDGLIPDDRRENLPDPEDCNYAARFLVRGANDEPCGRLIVTLQPWLNEPSLRLDLSVRGAPATPDVKGTADFLDEGRRIIVQAFTAVTTARMHELWGRTK